MYSRASTRLTYAVAAEVFASAAFTVDTTAVAPFAGAEAILIVIATCAIGGIDLMSRTDALVADAGGAVFSLD